jgi:rare lipoprotein A (peptidoglycan hydrolase)
MNKFLLFLLLNFSLFGSNNLQQSLPTNETSKQQTYPNTTQNFTKIKSSNYSIADNYNLLKEYNQYISENEDNEFNGLESLKYNPYKNQIVSDFEELKGTKYSSYRLFGKTDTPHVPHVGQIYKGVASWYGDKFQGKETANGEKYNKYMYTAAHKTLPLNTIVEVLNTKTNTSVVVRINDRGPYVGNRLIDLSYIAAKKLGIVGYGTHSIKIKILGMYKK